MTQRTSRIGSHAGFTLIELTLAIAIGGMVLTAVYGLFSAGVDTQQRVTRVASQTQAWRFFTERLRSDLRNLLVDEQTLGGDRNELTLNLANAGQVRYLRHDEAGAGRIRRTLVDEADTSDTEVTGTIVYEGVTEMRFRYLDDDKWRDEPGDELPRAVECTVEDGHRERRLVVALEVDDVAD